MSLVNFWFVVIGVLWAGFLILEGFDFGVGALQRPLGRDEAGQETVLGTIAPVWDGNEVWLVVAGAGMFAAFPGWYAAMFSAMYLALVLLLVALILRGVALVLRSKRSSPVWRRNWDALLAGSSVVAPLLIGVALGDLLHGIPIGANQVYTGTFWELLQPYAIYLGITMVGLCLLHGCVFVVLKTRGEIRDRAAGTARALGPVAGALVIGFAIWTQVMAGGGVGPWLVEAVAVVAAVAAAGLAGRGHDAVAFTLTLVTIAAVAATIFVNLHPRVMVSTLGAADDLTVQNTSSAHYSLTVMTWVAAILLPAVLVYQAWTYYTFRHRLGQAPAAAGPAPTPPPVQAPPERVTTPATPRPPTDND